MSRSYKKAPGSGHTTASSEKKDKQLWHRRWRAGVRTRLVGALRKDEGVEGFLDISFREISSTWCMSKDGRAWYGRYTMDKEGSLEEQSRRWRSIFGK